nr:reverse transcriptase domain-containing protein [Tanacetum cinerariifolium]
MEEIRLRSKMEGRYHPPSPDYIPGPEEPEQVPPSPDYVPGLEHADDEIVAEDQPYAEDASPNAQSPNPIRSLGYRAAMIRLRAEAASTSSPPLQLPSARHREDRPEVTLPPRKKLGIVLGPGYEVGESSSTAAARPAGGLRADYGFVATMDREIMRDPEREVGYGITDSWDEIVEALQGAPTEARMSREAWVRSTDASDLVRGEVMSLRTTILGQMMEIRELHATDRRRQIVISELLRTNHKRSTEIIELRTALQGQAMINQGVTAALAARDALRSTNGDDSHNSEIGVSRTERATRECAYTNFLNNYAVENQVKFATCTLHSVALTWWNTHVKTVGHEAAYRMPWKTLMKMMTKKYYPPNEIRKLEMELWDLKVKGTNLASYTQRYQELALLCGRMFSEESDKIEKYIGGLPDMIHGSVVASKPTTMQKGGVEIATELMDKKIRTFAERETASKRKFENTSRNTQNQQQQS